MRKALFIVAVIAALIAGKLATQGHAEADVAREIARQLHGRADDATVVLTEGRLVVTDRAERGENAAHFHVKLGVLDACSVGVGDTPDERARSVADHFVRTAWPVFASHVHRRPQPGAVRFHGGEQWGVPGHTGFVGGALTRGAKGKDVPNGDGLFAGVPNLPSDGAAHLVKVVLNSQAGSWRRSIELDGDTQLESEATFAGTPPTDAVMVTQFAVIEGVDRVDDASARLAAIRDLLTAPAWLPATTGCPVVPTLTTPPFADHACSGGRFADCVRECSQGEGPSCYAAAIDVEKEHASLGHALHLAACQTGHASGCTNAAATRQSLQGQNACSTSVFAAVCEKAGDPWACVMFGRTLLGDPTRAKAVLAKACLFGDDDPACATAKRLLATLADK